MNRPASERQTIFACTGAEVSETQPYRATFPNSCWIDASDARVPGRAMNDAIGGMVAQAPDQFIGLGMGPLQDPELAVRELEVLIASGRRCSIRLAPCAPRVCRTRRLLC